MDVCQTMGADAADVSLLLLLLLWLSAQQNKRNSGNWTGRTIRRAWNVIISDKFSPYFNLNTIRYIHLMVNHSENFVDPYTGAHSNRIEGVWSQIKRRLKAMNGTHRNTLPGYLDEFNWRKCHPGDHFDNLLADIAEFCPPN